MAEMQVRIMSDGGIDDPEALQAEFLRQRRAMAEARGKARAAEMAAAEQGEGPAAEQGVAPAAEQGVAHEDST